MKDIKYHFLIIFATFLVGGTFLSSAKLSGLVNPISLTLLRFVIAAALLLPVVLCKPKYRRRIIATIPRGLGVSLAYSTFFICMFEALETTTPLNTGTLYTLAPFITAILCLLLFRQRISRKQLIAYFMGIIGTLWVVFEGNIDLFLSFSLNKGDIIFIIATVCICLYSVSMKLLYRNDDMPVIFFCTLIGGVFWVGISLLIFDLPLEWHKLHNQAFLHIGYLAIFATLGTSYLYQIATVKIGPSKVMAYIYLNPVSVAILLFLFEGLPIPAIVLPGIIISMIATVILQLNASEKTKRT